MTSPDPAIEAAIRAWIKPRGGWARKHFNPEIPGSARSLTDAAREALTPIRGLHRSIDLYLWATTACERQEHRTSEDTETGDPICLTCTENDGGPGKFCAECFDNDGSNIAWPCATARAVYSEEELA